MKLLQRKLVLPEERQRVLDFHCEVNYACDSQWAREASYSDYREKWLSTAQPEQFIAHLSATMEDPRTLADLLLDPDTNEIAGFVWVAFQEIAAYGLVIAELVDLIIAPKYRGQGNALALLRELEKQAARAGANLFRSETGFANAASKSLHARAGFEPYRVLYEKRIGAIPNVKEGP